MTTPKKKSMFLYILIGLVAIIGVFLIIVAMQANEYRVTRSATIAAPPAIVFDQVNDLHKMEVWSPWVKMDPAIKQTYEGPGAGKGAIYSWVGNNQVGEGRMTVTESKPNELVQFKIEFFKPMAGVSLTEFTFKPEGNQTTVTWTMTGEKNFMSKAICMFMNMDKMIGGQFEKGLAEMKAIAETAAKK